MSSRQFALAYSFDRDDPMSDAELRFRIDVATEHVELVHRTEIIRTPVGDGRTGFVVWQAVKSGPMWPSAARRHNEDAEWVPFLPSGGQPPEGRTLHWRPNALPAGWVVFEFAPLITESWQENTL